MPGGATAAKLTELEQAMAELAHAQAQSQRRVDSLAASLDRHAAETRASLDRHAAETKANFDRYAAETKATLDRLAADIANTNRAAGEAVNKSGRLVEDLVYPSIPELFARISGLSGEPGCMMRVRREPRSAPGKNREFDAVAYGGDVFLLCSVKSTLGANHVGELLGLLPRVRDFFWEAEGRRIVGALASFYLDPSLVTAGERSGLYMLGMRTGLVEVLNSPSFKPAEF